MISKKKDEYFSEFSHGLQVAVWFQNKLYWLANCCAEATVLTDKFFIPLSAYKRKRHISIDLPSVILPFMFVRASVCASVTDGAAEA